MHVHERGVGGGGRGGTSGHFRISSPWTYHNQLRAIRYNFNKKNHIILHQLPVSVEKMKEFKKGIKR
jgi:hypothetical protein